MTNAPKIKCKKCKIEMILIRIEVTMAELDSDATDGQIADYFGALESGDYGNWAVKTGSYQCPQCKEITKYQFF